MVETQFRSERRRRFHHNLTESPESSPGESVAHDDVAADASPPAPSLAGGEVHTPTESPWKALDDAARGGAWVFVRSAEGEQAEAKFYETRRYDAKAMRWVPLTRWVRRNCGGAYLNWEPVAYRVFDPSIDLPAWPKEAL